jgi:hypothetical protein
LAAARQRLETAEAGNTALTLSLGEARQNIEAEQAEKTDLARSLAEARESLQAEKAASAEAREGLRTEQADRSVLASSLHDTREQLARCRTQIDAGRTFLLRAWSGLAAEQGLARVTLHALAGYFAAACVVDVPREKWTAFARAVQDPQPSLADGAATSVWVLDVWNSEDEDPVPPSAQAAPNLYAAFCARAWSAGLSARLSQFAATLARADSTDLAVMRILVDEACGALAALDAASPSACACALGICQFFLVLHTRWPRFVVPVADAVGHVGSVLAVPVANLLLGTVPESGPS